MHHPNLTEDAEEEVGGEDAVNEKELNNMRFEAQILRMVIGFVVFIIIFNIPPK